MKYKFDDEILKNFNDYRPFSTFIYNHNELRHVMSAHRYFYIYEEDKKLKDRYHIVDINPIFVELYKNGDSYQAILDDCKNNLNRGNTTRIPKKIIDQYFEPVAQLIYPDE